MAMMSDEKDNLNANTIARQPELGISRGTRVKVNSKAYTAGGVRLFRESWKGQRSAINKRVPIWFVLNYRQLRRSSATLRHHNRPFRIHNEYWWVGALQ